MITMKVHGGEDLLKAMSELTTRVQGNVVRGAMKQAAEPMRRDMSRRAPFEPGPPDLRDNFVIGNAKGKRGEVAVAVGPTKNFFYAFYNEYGTVHQSARPFMRPALDSGAARAIADIGRSMWDLLSKRGIFKESGPSTVGGRFL